MAKNRVLVLFSHPVIHKSRVNRVLARAAREIESVTFVDLYAEYPDFYIDVRREQERLLAHDIIVQQHPFYWYSAPAIVKEWCDLVLEYGFAYGENGDRLEGKTWVHAITTGGSAAAYRPEGTNRFPIRALLAPFDQTAHLCGMRFLDPFVVHGALGLDQATQIPQAAARYREFLIGLRDGNLPPSGGPT